MSQREEVLPIRGIESYLLESSSDVAFADAAICRAKDHLKKLETRLEEMRKGPAYPDLQRLVSELEGHPLPRPKFLQTLTACSCQILKRIVRR